MVVMTNELIIKYQNEINYSNADSMFNALDTIINQYGRNFILQEEHKNEEECVKSYVARTSAMRFASDAIEHYIKAILIQDGHSWDESKSLGHSLLDLYSHLSNECKEIINFALKPLNKYVVDYNDVANIYNSYYSEEYYILVKLLEKYKLFGKDEINEDKINNINYNYFLDNFLNKKKLSKNYPLCENKSKIEHKLSFRENISSLSEGQTIEGELDKLRPQTRHDQHFGIKARFPGQFLVKGNAEFLISLAYAMHDISFKYRKNEDLYPHP